MAFGNEFVPLDINLIEGGVFMEDVHQEIEKLQTKLAAYLSDYGQEAGKAKATVTLKIELEVDSVKDKTFKISGSFKSTAPTRPKRTTTAFLLDGKKNKKGVVVPQLFIRGTGSTAGDPRQMHLDLESQVEPVEEPAKSGEEN